MPRRWRFKSRESGFEIVSELWLYPELDWSHIVGDLDTDDGDEQLAAVVDCVRRRNPSAWQHDRVPILWSVEGSEGIGEFAPYVRPRGEKIDFLTFFTWPTDAATGKPLDWFRDLEVRNDRFPAFAKALGWKPAPFTATAPLKSI